MSVRKRTWKTAQGEEKQAWIVDYVDQAGKRHIRTFDKKKAADTHAAAVRVEVGQGIHTPQSESITVAKAGELWLATCHAEGLERTTIGPYEQHLRLHINPFLGRVKLSELSAPMVTDFRDKLRQGAAAPGEADGTVRSPAMVKRIIGSLGSLLGDAQEHGRVARNVVRDLRSNRRRGKDRRAEKRQKGKLKIGEHIPTTTEIKAIVGHLSGRYRPFLLTAIFTGLRSSELRGLRWADVDFEKRELHVRQRADRYKEIGKPKTEAGERVVPLPPIVVNTLREWKLASPKGALDLAFPTGNGSVEYHVNIIHRGLIPAQIAAGVVKATGRADEAGKPIMAAKYPGLHALRHFYASWCINRKVDGGLELPPKVVQERLGHSSITMTLDVYGHLFPRGDDSAELAAAELSLLG
jgi:integrase